MVNIAVVGLGFMGKMHITHYQTIENARVTALCDKFTDRLDVAFQGDGGNIDLSTEHIDLSGISKYNDYEQMLNSGGFDAVDICLPTDLHVTFSIKALDAGYHLFIEKPLALDYEGAIAISEKAEQSGRICSVGHCLRFWPAYTEVKKIIESGTFGKVRHAELSRYSPPVSWDAENWLKDSLRSGNASLDLHIHDIDMILWLFGAPRSLRSVGIPDNNGFFSHISTVYDYEQLSVFSSGGWSMSSSCPFNMRALFILESGVIDLDFLRQETVMIYPENAESYALELPEGDGYKLELSDFVSRCASGIPSEIVSPHIAAESVRLARIEIESARKGSQIIL